MLTTTFPKAVRQLRKSLDLTQRELAQRIGCTEDLICKIEAGRRKPSKQMAGLLADALRVPSAERDAFVASARADELARAADAAKPTPPHRMLQTHTRLFGRERDVQRIAAKLSDASVRLVTLAGMGGIGKTRLAVAAAQVALRHFPGGVWFVALESVPSHEFVMGAIAMALGVQVAYNAPIKAQVIAWIAANVAKPVLLILDNFEHVSQAASEVLMLIDACPNLTCLATSRERLRLRAEQVIVVQSLEVPEEDALLTRIAESPAAQLFADRAAALDAVFEWTDVNASAVAALCRQLEGVPLAIELMAAQTHAYTLESLAAGLQARVLSITSDMVDIPGRQRSLWHTADWSYSLLTADEQRCFRRLAALPGGASLAAAMAICDGPFIERTLQSLIDKNLILSNAHAGEMRFGLLMPLREYGLAQLAQAQETQVTHRAILDYFVAHAEALHAQYFANAPNMDEQWRTLALDLDNLRAAIRWADEADDTAAFVRLSCALRRFMKVRGHLAEGMRWAARAIERVEQAHDLPEPQRTRLRADAFGVFGTYLMDAGDVSLATDNLCKAAAYAREVAHTTRLISSLINLAYCQSMLGDYAEAMRVCADCAAVCEAAGDAASLVDVRACMGTVALRQNNLPEARLQFGLALDLYWRNENTSGLLITMSNLAVVHEQMGNLSEALRLNTESLNLARTAGMSFVVASTSGNVAGLQIKLGNILAARPYLSESLRMSQGLQELEFLANGFVSAAKLALFAEEPETAAAFLGMAQRVQRERRALFSPGTQAEAEAIQRALGDAAV